MINKLYCIIKIDGVDVKSLKKLIQKNKCFKSYGFYNLDDYNLLISFNLINDILLEKNEDFDNYISVINNIFDEFDINTSLFYNYNNTKKCIYKKPNNTFIQIKDTKLDFIDDE